MTSNTFAAAAGDVLQFFFNFVTSDGAGFSDYDWAELNNLTSPSSFLLFSAQTILVGDTVPGFGLPGLGAGVTVGATAIISGAPVWSALGDSSGRCFALGCGYTDWVSATYTIVTAGNYSLGFGVTNFGDQFYDTGLAVAGANIGGAPISPIPLPAAGWLLVAALGSLGVMHRRRQS